MRNTNEVRFRELSLHKIQHGGMKMRNKRVFSKIFERVRPGSTSLIVIVLCLLFLTGTNPSLGEENILTFYNKAAAKIQSPPDESYLQLICRKKIDNLYVTFVGWETGKVLLAAITEKKLKKPDENILLKVLFIELPEPPFGQPTAGNIVDWGYVYDRNGNGKIDYVSYLVGPMPVEQKDFPADYPKRGESVNLSELKIFLDSNQLLFTHWADDNYDGKVDAVVFEALDPERDWVEGWMVVRSSKFDGVVDEGWYFKDDINVKEKDAERAGNGFRTRRIPGIEPVFGPGELAQKDRILNMFNKAAEKCKLTSNSFYHR